MKKRILCIVLVLLAVTALLPVSALAAGSNTITTIALEIRPPIVDEAMPYSMDLPADAHYRLDTSYRGPDNSFGMHLEEMYWNGGISWEDINYYFENQSYTFQCALLPEDGYNFGTVSATVNGEPAKVSYDDADLIVSYSFTAIVPEMIETVSVTVPEPVAGEKPRYEAQFPEGAGYYLENYMYEYSQESEWDDEYYDAFRNNIAWYNISDDMYIDADSDYRFETGKRYSVTVILTPSPGFYFEKMNYLMAHEPLPNSTINGEKPHYWGPHGWSGYPDGIELSYAFPELIAPSTGWVKNPDSKWSYYKADGTLAKGWYKVSGKWYYSNASGIMLTGWQKVGGKWYYLGGNGAMVTGWKQLSGKWYYMNGSGVMQTGWVKVGTKWYYMNSSGAMQTGWVKVSGKWYYLNSSGAMQTGWVKVSGVWYYMNSSGAMQTGWLKLSGKWYYLKSSGAMACSESLKIGTKTYNFNSSGVCTNP